MTPTAAQLDHLIGHTDHRALTPDEHAALRAGVQTLRASLAGTGAALRRAPSGAYVTQLRQQAARATRYRIAWQNARRRSAEFSAALDCTAAAAEQGCNELGHLAHDLLTRAEQAEARIAAVRELHQPVTGCNGWGPDGDPTPGAYGSISLACSACGSQDDAIRWPCGTIRALDASAEAAP